MSQSTTDLHDHLFNLNHHREVRHAILKIVSILSQSRPPTNGNEIPIRGRSVSLCRFSELIRAFPPFRPNAMKEPMNVLAIFSTAECLSTNILNS
jgi:hypothetical protein